MAKNADLLGKTRKLIAEYGAELYERRLTDVAGGNISVRVGDVILMTPTLAGGEWHWHLLPEQVLTFDLKGNQLEGEGTISREAKVHFTLLNEFYPDGQSVVHGHSRNVLVFCAAEKPIPPVLNCTMKFGEIPQIPDAASGTQQLADNVAEAMRSQRERIRKQAAAVMAPRHGIFVLGKDLKAAFDATERIDTNAFCILMGSSLFDAKRRKEMPYRDEE